MRAICPACHADLIQFERTWFEATESENSRLSGKIRRANPGITRSVVKQCAKNQKPKTSRLSPAKLKLCQPLPITTALTTAALMTG
jgi:hypothetical protein